MKLSNAVEIFIAENSLVNSIKSRHNRARRRLTFQSWVTDDCDLWSLYERRMSDILSTDSNCQSVTRYTLSHV